MFVIIGHVAAQTLLREGSMSSITLIARSSEIVADDKSHPKKNPLRNPADSPFDKSSILRATSSGFGDRATLDPVPAVKEPASQDHADLKVVSNN